MSSEYWHHNYLLFERKDWSKMGPNLNTSIWRQWRSNDLAFFISPAIFLAKIHWTQDQNSALDKRKNWKIVCAASGSRWRNLFTLIAQNIKDQTWKRFELTFTLYVIRLWYLFFNPSLNNGPPPHTLTNTYSPEMPIHWSWRKFRSPFSDWNYIIFKTYRTNYNNILLYSITM